MKRFTLPLFTLVAALSLTLSAHATQLDFTNTTLGTGGTVTGYIDVSGGAVTGSDIVVSLNSKTYTFTGDGVSLQGLTTFSDIFTDATASLDIVLPLNILTGLTGYDGGNLCSLDHECKTIIGTNIQSSFTTGLFNTTDLTSGSLNPTPEPSSLILLGTGALGMVGAARRRFLRA